MTTIREMLDLTNQETSERFLMEYYRFTEKTLNRLKALEDKVHVYEEVIRILHGRPLEIGIKPIGDGK